MIVARFRRWAPLTLASALCACAMARGPGGERGTVTVEADGWAASSGPDDVSASGRAVIDALSAYLWKRL